MEPLKIAASGMVAQQLRVDMIANNLANMNTTGYQRRRAEFNDLLYEEEKRPNNIHSRTTGDVPSGVQAGSGVRLAATYRVVEQGNLKQTGNPLDIAIQGPGYIPVKLASGDTAYTRAGAFQLDQNGTIVTHDGLQVAPGITVPAEAVEVSVNRSGEVLALIQGAAKPQNLGQIQLARFPNEGGLSALGNNLFTETGSSGTATLGVPGDAGFGTILQGFLETSNVNPVQEMTQMIKALKAYQMNSKVVQVADQMMSDRPSA